MMQKRLRIVVSILAGLIIAAPALADAPPTTRPVGNELAITQAKLKAIEAKLQKGFEDSPELKAAVDRVIQAQAACDAARARIVASLSGNPDYQAAVQQRATAQQAFDQARQSNELSQDQVAILAQQAMTARAAVMKMENDAMAADPSAAEKNLAAAKDALQQLRQKHHDSIKNDPDWKAAEKELEDARAAVKGCSISTGPGCCRANGSRAGRIAQSDGSENRQEGFATGWEGYASRGWE